VSELESELIGRVIVGVKTRTVQGGAVQLVQLELSDGMVLRVGWVGSGGETIPSVEGFELRQRTSYSCRRPT
jgi:hypothetical protein